MVLFSIASSVLMMHSVVGLQGLRRGGIRHKHLHEQQVLQPASKEGPSFTDDISTYTSANGTAGMKTSQRLGPGESIYKDIAGVYSWDKKKDPMVYFTRYELVMQEDCNAVLYEYSAQARDKHPIVLKRDANREVLPLSEQPEVKDRYLERVVWSSDTNGQGSDCQLVLPAADESSEQLLYVVDGQGAVLWSSGSKQAGLISLELSACGDSNDPRVIGTYEDESTDERALPGMKEGVYPFITPDRYIGRPASCGE